jgi:ankyrin repeat protein
LLKFLKRFRWVFCQLETLRHCLPPSVRRTLDELPESLDETYERLLKEIKKPNRDHARRLLQCLVAAIRPLRVEELAEVLAVDFDDAQGIPKLNPNWRWEDEEQALLTSCSSLIAIVETGHSRVVQFSHFSVKEFLTSTRLADPRKDASRYHIDLEPAHTVLAQACMGVLLQPDDRVDDNSIWRSFPLAVYAAQYWVTHARFKSVSSSLKKAMEDLFDLDKPHFATWLELHNIDIEPSLRIDLSSLSCLAASFPFNASPLYYAALCGFQDLVEHLSIKHPQYVNTDGGWYGTPLVAALAGRHFQTAKFLHDNGAHLDIHYKNEDTPLHSAAYYGDLEMVQVLLGYEVDVNARTDEGWTPLHDAALNSSHLQNVVKSSPDVARILLEHGANVSARSNSGLTTLHIVADVELVRVLLEHGANVGTEDEEGRTPLHGATANGSVELVRVILEHGADINAQTNDNSTPLLVAAKYGITEVVRALLEHGANVGTEDGEGRTALHEATRTWDVELVRMLLEHSADVNARTKDSSTPLLVAVTFGSVEVVQMLIKHGADVSAEDEKGRTPLHGAAVNRNRSVDLVRVLIEHGADINTRFNDSSTPLHKVAANGSAEDVRVLLEHRANVDAQDEKRRTPLHEATRNGSVELVRVVLDHGADINARTSDTWTPLLVAARYGNIDVMRVLLEHGANVETENKKGRTSFQIASVREYNDIVELLSDHGAKDVFSVSTSSLCLPW